MFLLKILFNLCREDEINVTTHLCSSIHWYLCCAEFFTVTLHLLKHHQKHDLPNQIILADTKSTIFSSFLNNKKECQLCLSSNYWYASGMHKFGNCVGTWMYVNVQTIFSANGTSWFIVLLFTRNDLSINICQ